MIRFWITDAMIGLPDRVRAFWEDLRFETADRPCPATILNMLAQAAPGETHDLIALRLTQDILTAMLSGVDLPPDLLPAIVRRIRTDGRIDGQRAAVLKAVLARRARLSGARAAQAILDPEAAVVGNEVTVVWGEEGGGSPRPVVERHFQKEIRATVQPWPYAKAARSYRPGG